MKHNRYLPKKVWTLSQEHAPTLCRCEYSYYLIKKWEGRWPEKKRGKIPVCFKEDQVRLFNYDTGKWEKVNELGNLYEKDGKYYRIRRGELVRIPDEWYGHVTHRQTIMKRKSKEKKGAGQYYKQKVQRKSK